MLRCEHWSSNEFDNYKEAVANVGRRLASLKCFIAFYAASIPNGRTIFKNDYMFYFKSIPVIFCAFTPLINTYDCPTLSHILNALDAHCGEEHLELDAPVRFAIRMNVLCARQCVVIGAQT
jgi:hypothetical protein